MRQLKFITVLFFLTAINANAQFGGLLKGLTNEIDKAAQSIISGKDSSPTSTSPNGVSSTQSQKESLLPAVVPDVGVSQSEVPSRRVDVPSSNLVSNQDRDKLINNYCTNVSNSVIAKELAKRISYSKNNLGGRAEFPSFGYDFNKKLQDWLNGKFNKLNLKGGKSSLAQRDRDSSTNVKNDEDDFQLMSSTINNCFSGLMTKNWLYLISQDSQFDTLDGIFNPQTSGIKKGDDVIWRVQRSQKINWAPSKSREEFLYGFFFEDFDAFLTETYPKLLSDFDNRIAISVDNYNKGKLKDEASAKENQKFNDEVAAKKAYLNSPDGQLTYTYERFQIVDLCHSGRKEYAVKYVTDGEFSDLKSKVKAIENKLKGSLVEKNTDKLWAKAEANNRNFMGIGLDAIEVFKNKGGDRVLCNNAAIEINDVANNVLGKESLKKSF